MELTVIEYTQKFSGSNNQYLNHFDTDSPLSNYNTVVISWDKSDILITTAKEHREQIAAFHHLIYRSPYTKTKKTHWMDTLSAQKRHWNARPLSAWTARFQNATTKTNKKGNPTIIIPDWDQPSYYIGYQKQTHTISSPLKKEKTTTNQ